MYNLEIRFQHENLTTVILCKTSQLPNQIKKIESKKFVFKLLEMILKNQSRFGCFMRGGEQKIMYNIL